MLVLHALQAMITAEIYYSGQDSLMCMYVNESSFMCIYILKICHEFGNLQEGLDAR